ncbi:MAG: 4Fe-4S dicluster domain-containing protein [Clostridiales bacterium]|jgi:2-oxoglutarate ferredoxin oxidoreductase subunit delta|nr:4Fe-4S dicluster domain-containing protein [Clostridiales bacterium]
MANVVFNEPLCKGCALCVSVCPKKIVSLSKRSNEKGYFVAEVKDMSLCIGCAACALMCPDVVIEVSR